MKTKVRQISYLSMWMAFALMQLAIPCMGEDAAERLSLLQASAENVNKQVLGLRRDLQVSKQRLASLKAKGDALRNREESLQSDLDDIALELLQVEKEISGLKRRNAELGSRRQERLRVIDESDQELSIFHLIASGDGRVDRDDFLLLSTAIQKKENAMVLEGMQNVQKLTEKATKERELLKQQKQIHENIRKERVELSKIVIAREVEKDALSKKEGSLRSEMMSLQAEALRLETVLSSWSADMARADAGTERKSRRVLVVPAAGLPSADQFLPRSLLRPLQGVVTRNFQEGDQTDPFRNGISIEARGSARQSIDILAVADGEVSFRGKLPFFGDSLIIEHGEGEFSLYGGLQSLSIKLAQQVKRGEPIGRIQGGDSLYLELRKDGVSVNPEPLFPSSAS